MTTRNQSTHEWWKDQEDRGSQSAFLASYRQAQRERSSAAWRRIVSIGVFTVAILFLLRTVASL